MQQSRDERSLGELISELTRELSTLTRQEFALAKTEMSEKVSSVGHDLALVAAGGAVAYAGFLVLLAFLVLLIGLVLPYWLSALIVGVVVIAIGGYLAKKYWTAFSRVDPTPQETVESLKEDSRWLKEQA
ncbi:MAG TPA: phage holin family protein [Thermomicrobiaceae bacterium]|nr:phage holin family protein [Thermomicrobiaceae bacterium]